jgi:hypothetical protein
MEKQIGFSVPGEITKVVVKFKKEAGVRFTGTELTSITQADLRNVRTILEKFPDCDVKRTFDGTEDQLDAQTASMRAETGVEVPELSSFYHITTKNRKQSEALVAELEKDPLIEEAYIEIPAVPALFISPPQAVKDEPPDLTPDFTSLQGYLNAAPEGVNAGYGWDQHGGKGENIQIIDIEGAWNFSNEDLLRNQGGIVGGVPSSDIQWENHGTAVQGVIGADENEFGMMGIVPEARFSGIAIFGEGNSPARAIKTASGRLTKGDIILIELHRPGPDASGRGQDGYIPIEWWSAEFAAVKYATTKGIIVVAAAGNGSRDLDDAIYQDRFNRVNRDSGSIIVGAGAPPNGSDGPDRSRLPFSNYGNIVDAQGWGQDVATTGYGDLQGGINKNKWYTEKFSGTSSASPIVVGTIASIQSVRKGKGVTPYTYIELRDILRRTGSPQTDAPNRPKSQRIGNRPDIKAALGGDKAVETGVASRYWIECVPYGTTGETFLWLYVENDWRYMEKPAQSVLDLVQRAFIGSGSVVRVAYEGATIAGIVVEGS